ncbi:hypothetical protein AA0Z99_05335 [Agrococcus sp. 1P02AA]|uniref:hypothetical protein n=1 Tax=Agrococcus sp. 1P02AA TaxID=3132259 RepID=UPI0039A72941
MADEHQRLQAFVGDWSADGTAYGADADGSPWRSIHSARWNTGGRTQTHHFEFRPEGEWITLCDRIAHRVD